MRLSSVDAEKIRSAIRKFITDFDLFLYGSRIDDTLRGGDIDLFLVVADDQVVGLKARQHYLEAELSVAMDDQRIDLKIIGSSAVHLDAFFSDSAKVKL